MSVAYRLHCANINEVENVYVGVIEFKTRDANEMAKYIQGLGEDADELYTIEEYHEDDAGNECGDPKYYLPGDFMKGVE